MDEAIVVRGFMASRQVLPLLVVYFHFNPATLTDNKGVDYEPEERHSGGGPRLQYKGGGTREISFTLFLDAFDARPGTSAPVSAHPAVGISSELATLRSFLYQRSDSVDIHRASFGRPEGVAVTPPPTCIFGFGPTCLECRVTGLGIRLLSHSHLLVPTRAEVDVSLSVIEAPSNRYYQEDRVRRVAGVAAQSALFAAELVGAFKR